MADVTTDKKLKLANTRKRFKELQELKKKRNESGDSSKPTSANSSTRNTPVESMAISYIDNTEDIETVAREVAEFVITPSEIPQNSQEAGSSESALPNYFKQSPAAFFDTISPVENASVDHNTPSLLTYFNTDRQNMEPENIGVPKYFDNIHSSDRIWENTVPETSNANNDDYKLFPRGETISEHATSTSPIQSDDARSLEYPEISALSKHIRKSVDNLNMGPFPVAQCYENNMFSPGDSQKLMDYLGTTGATEEEKTDICLTNTEIDNSTDLTKKEIQDSNNVESLKQISNQLAHIIEPTYDYSTTNPITDLEKRNIELVANLDSERIQSEQLKAINSQLQTRIAQLEQELTKQETSLLSAQEVAQLKNELQINLQTIGLLVAEKTELSSNLGQYEMICKQKTSEGEELQARLRASRTRVADLERELNLLKSDKAKTETMGEQYSATLENLRREYQVLRDQKDELTQDLLEVREKLKNTVEDNLKLQQDNKDISGKFSLAEIKIQQLSSGGPMDSQIEQLAQDKFSLESELANLNQMLKSIIKERDESHVQYQQYAQQLNAQISNLSAKLEQLQHEKENLVIQEQNRIKHIGELERQLQNIQSDQVTYATRNASSSELRGELDKSREMCVQLQIEKTSVEENFTKVSNEKDLLLKELEAKTDSISQLESMIEQLRGNQPDSVKLLATMESDKIAASRAIQQNKELKQQLEGMQEVFMKMDNDKVELTENLKAQQQTNKELIEKLQKTEISLQSLADAIEIKDKELTHLRESFEEMNRQAHQHEHLEDRLRHYEAHDNSAHILQNDLQDAQKTIAKLSHELDKKNSEENMGKLKKQLDEALRTIVELTNEINKLKNTSEEIIVEPKEDFEVAAEVEENTDKNENVLDKEHAMKCLEEKVKRTMQEIADLTDEKQRLEHIVLQLQGETETIGEYVALYQHQRAVLKQKAVEKDQQLKQLADDREQIKIKLDKLNELIRRLVIEKGTVPPELLLHQESMSSHVNSFCEEHSKMHEDINSIKRSNVIEPESEEGVSRTAEEIISLLSEIKTSNLVQPDENFHHCPWCSGQLMTV